MAPHPWEREPRALCENQFDFLISDHRCQRRGRFISGGLEVFYWNAVTGVRVLVQYRDPFTVDVCPLPEGRFPPRPEEYGARRRIEWFDAFDVVRLITGRRQRFNARQLYGNDPEVIAANADAIRGPCEPLLGGDSILWSRLRRQRRARIAYWARRREPALGRGYCEPGDSQGLDLRRI